MRAFIAHRQTFVIWGCIYLWDSNPFLLYRSLRATDPDPTVVRVKLFFLLYYELLPVSFLPFLPSYRFFKITFFLQFLRSMKLKNKNIMTSTYQRSFKLFRIKILRSLEVDIAFFFFEKNISID